MRIISFIDQPDVIKKILRHLSLWEESHAPLERDPPIKEIIFDPFHSQLLPRFYLSSRMARARFAAGRSQQRWSQACVRGHFLVSIANAR